MNSINILTGISSPSTPSTPTGRARSGSESLPSEKGTSDVLKRSQSQNVFKTLSELASQTDMVPIKREEEDDAYPNGYITDEKTPLLQESKIEPSDIDITVDKVQWTLPSRIAAAFVSAVRIVIAVVTAPTRFLARGFYDQDGQFSIVLPIYRVGGLLWRKNPRDTAQPLDETVATAEVPVKLETRGTRSSSRLRATQPESSSALTSDSETESHQPDDDTPARNTRSKSAALSNEIISPSKRSIRIKLSSDEALKQRKQRSRHMSSHLSEKPTTAEELAAAIMKSPTSPNTTGSTITKYPRTPAPPRPLVPRRQPSYSNNVMSSEMRHEKTLILDLDETLIHSMSKGGRFTTGHMVEVRMRQTMGVGGVTIGPEVPVLYYVHKRPHCDDFLRKVSKWYNLVIFTASVQEYADPVIDWLELERKYFAKRYYRDQCTFRNGAYVKDLGIVESDLSKVMIIDNSPLSYMFNEDNAIPIEGWISDPTDNDLLHLVPLLEGLQYATDVRAVLALRLGEPQLV